MVESDLQGDKASIPFGFSYRERLPRRHGERTTPTRSATNKSAQSLITQGTQPNLKNKHRFRKCHPLVCRSEKVTVARRRKGTPQGTNYPLPLDSCFLKELLERVSWKWASPLCHLWLRSSSWNPAPSSPSSPHTPPLSLLLLYCMSKACFLYGIHQSQESHFHRRLPAALASDLQLNNVYHRVLHLAVKIRWPVFAHTSISGPVACTPLWGWMCFRWCVFSLWSLFAELHPRFLCAREKNQYKCKSGRH